MIPGGSPRASSASDLERRLTELGALVEDWTRAELRGAIHPPADPFGSMLGYHLGWNDADLRELPVAVSGGKKLRPALALLVSEAVCGSIDPAREAAVALELVHNFSLVHDDVQDRSATRRHRATVWSVWGSEQAINAGDALFALAQVVLLRPGTELSARLGAVLNTACVRLVEGQFLDIALQQGTLGLSAAAYEAMVARKTGALFEAACRIGAIAAGGDAASQDAYARYGLQLGIAFQEQDDLLGVWGSMGETGKPEAADVVSRKKALPAVLSLVRDDVPDWLGRAYRVGGEDLPGETVLRVIEHFDTLGIREEVERRVEQRHQAARVALEATSARQPARDHLAALCDELVGRQS